MSYVLIIAEKPDSARRISEAIADKKPKQVQRNGARYYDFTVKGKHHICVPAVGHMFVLEAKRGSAKGWGYPVFDYDWIPAFKRKGTGWTERYFKNIQELAASASEFVDAADYDTEGEVLLYNILRFICKVNDAKRMKFSTLTKDELAESYEKMDEHLMFPMVEAGLTRHYLDALWGINLTRALTLSLKAGGYRGFSVLSTGRVQGPALAILLEREIEIRSFKPEPFWEIELHIDIEGQKLTAVYEKGRIWDKVAAEKILADVKGKDAVVKDVKKESYRQSPPAPFNTTDLQAESYAQFGYSPRQTLEIAESLYQAGHISYPRSSSQKLPPSVGYEKIVKALGMLAGYKKFAGELLKKALRPVEGKRDDPAHPSVYATHEVPDLKRLDYRQKKVYDLIARRTLAAFGEAAVRETNTAKLDANGHMFVLAGKKTLKFGWVEIYAPYVKRDELILPELKIGQFVKVDKAELLSKETQPPGRYSQGSIIKELEDRNLGTKATRAEILQTLYDRGYVAGKSVNVTKLGEAVGKALKENCPTIVSEELTRRFEGEMEKVYAGHKHREKVVEEAKEVLGKILDEFKAREKDIGMKLAAGLEASWREASRIGKCPKCGNDLMMKKSKFGIFVGCGGYPECRNTYPLPRSARISALGKVCKTCDAPMIKVVRRWGRSLGTCIDTKCLTRVASKS